jgi:hypothetical protein
MCQQSVGCVSVMTARCLGEHYNPGRTCATWFWMSSQCSCLRLRSVLVAGDMRFTPSRSLMVESTWKQRTGMPAPGTGRHSIVRPGCTHVPCAVHLCC